jgi:hypothetical protein
MIVTKYSNKLTYISNYWRLKNNKLLKMKKTLALAALLALSVAGNTSIKHRLGQVKAKNLAQATQPPVTTPVDCPCDTTWNLAPPGQAVFNGFGQSAEVSQSE